MFYMCLSVQRGSAFPQCHVKADPPQKADAPRISILQWEVVNKRALRSLLECILVAYVATDLMAKPLVLNVIDSFIFHILCSKKYQVEIIP